MIDTEALKRKILDLAIRGKLVPQDPNDEPASELLKRIKNERDRLIDEGKIKGKKDDFSYIFKGDDNCYYEKIGKEVRNITDELPFEIPNNWAWTRIKTISKVKNGFTPLRNNPTFWENGDMPWFTINDIELNGGDFIYKTKESITRCAYKDERVIKPNTTLICCTASIGEVAFAKVPLITNQQFNAIELFPYINSINSLWIYIFALTLKPLLKRLMGATTFGFVSVSKVENILMPIPPLNEQNRIIQTYFQIQEKVKLVESNNKALNKLKEVIKRKIITLGVNGKLLDTDDNYYYQNLHHTFEPLHTQIKMLDQYRRPVNSNERKERIAKASIKYPYYGATGQAGEIDEYLLDGQYVLIGEDCAPFLDKYQDKAYIVNGKFWVNNHAHILSSKCNEFLCFYLNAFDYHQYVSGTTRLKLTQKDLKRMPYPVLSEHFQKQIAQSIIKAIKPLESIT